MKRIFPTALVMLLPSVAMAAAPRTFQELAYVVVLILNNATALLITAGIVVYFFGISTNILNFGSKGGADKVRTYFMWGIIALFVMVSIWGILRLVQATLFGDQAGQGNGVTVTPNQSTSPDLSGVPSFTGKAGF